MPLFSWFDHFLGARAEILGKLRTPKFSSETIWPSWTFVMFNLINHVFFANWKSETNLSGHIDLKKFVWVVLLFVGYKWRGNRQQTNVILSLIEGSCYGWQKFSYLKNKPEKKSVLNSSSLLNLMNNLRRNFSLVRNGAWNEGTGHLFHYSLTPTHSVTFHV